MSEQEKDQAGTPDPAPAAPSHSKRTEETKEMMTSPQTESKEHLGVLVEFETPDALMQAAKKVRDQGWSKWDAHTPFPVHGLDKAMGIRPTILPWLAFGGGLTGGLSGFFLQAYTNGVVLPFSLLQSDNWIVRELISPWLPSGYAFITSGKPIFSIPANIPVVFELTVLLAAFGAFFGVWLLSGLPRFFHPVFASERFKRASSDRYFISFEPGDPLYDRERTVAFARGLGGSHVEVLEG